MPSAGRSPARVESLPHDAQELVQARTASELRNAAACSALPLAARERILDVHPFDDLSRVQVFGQDCPAFGTCGRADDQGVPKGNLVLACAFNGREDERRIDVHYRILRSLAHGLLGYVARRDGAFALR